MSSGPVAYAGEHRQPRAAVAICRRGRAGNRAVPSRRTWRRVVSVTLTTVTFPSFHPFAGQTGIVNAFAIRHPEGVVLVDTGIGEGNAFVDQSYRPQRRAVGDELRAVGVDIGDVVAVVNGHLHFDNVGGNGLFPGVPILVQQAEWDAAPRGRRDLPGGASRLRCARLDRFPTSDLSPCRG
jgi:glyoxylase-like metal-dependent hydrolase (beta-lactamase superfamily II)